MFLFLLAEWFLNETFNNSIHSANEKHRCQKVAGTMQALMGGDEIYHYHTKVLVWYVKLLHWMCLNRIDFVIL